MTSIDRLDLRPGEWVEVRSEAEIFATLDDTAMLDGLPFMPEMLAHCGHRYRVFKRADKTCDTVKWSGLRGMERTVHLEMLRCDGSVHDGCQAGCLMFWKEAWLRRADEAAAPAASNAQANGANPARPRDRGWLLATIHGPRSEAGETCYRCQATELNAATRPLPWWEPKQYLRDVWWNRVSLGEVARGIAIAAYSKLRKLLFGRPFPYIAGQLKRTPSECLDLQPGEWVTVKTREEIVATLDTGGRNRGMTFDVEMLPYCGQTFRVLRRVERIIDEASGRMIKPAGVAIILEDVVCKARYRRSCPRSIFPYWREIWLRRLGPAEQPPAACPVAAACEAGTSGAVEPGSGAR